MDSISKEVENALKEINAKLCNDADKSFARYALMDFIEQSEIANPLDTLLDTLAMVAINKDDFSRIVTAEVILKYACNQNVLNEEKYFDLLHSMKHWGFFGFRKNRCHLLNVLNRSYKNEVDVTVS